MYVVRQQQDPWRVYTNGRWSLNYNEKPALYNFGEALQVAKNVGGYAIPILYWNHNVSMLNGANYVGIK